MEPLFLMFVADALQRRLDKAKQMVDSEGAGPFNVRWNAASSLGECFLTAEIEGMDEVTGFGGTRSYRTAAPDAIRYGNLAPVYFLDEELAIGEEEGVDVPLI